MYNSDRNQQSIFNLCAFMEQVIASPTEYCLDTALSSTLRSQGALANFSSSELHIRSNSLNTLKQHARKYIPGGFKKLEQLRHSAIEAVTKARTASLTKPRKKKGDLRDQLNAAFLRNQMMMEELELMTMLLQKTLSMACSYARQSEIEWLIILSQKESAGIYKYLTLRDPENDKN